MTLTIFRETETGSGLRFCDPQSAAKLFVKSYGHVGREFKLRPFSAGSILTLRKRIEPLASTTSVERTPRKIQSTKLTPSITAPGKLANHIACGLATSRADWLCF